MFIKRRLQSFEATGEIIAGDKEKHEFLSKTKRGMFNGKEGCFMGKRLQSKL